MAGRSVRVLIVAENASARLGGEAMLPLQYFRLLRERGVEAWLLAHDRTREELQALLPHERGRMHFVPDTAAHRALWAVGQRLPWRVETFTTGALSHGLTQLLQRRLAWRLVAAHGIDVVHQANPVSPRLPSALHGLGAPVVIGPMNGGMSHPPAFKGRQGLLERAVLATGRLGADLANLAVPGKRRAAALVVANARTRAALPRSVRRAGRVVVMAENGVDSRVFHPAPRRLECAAGNDGPARFVFVGRLVDWKGVDLLLEAFAPVVHAIGARLEVCGDGPERPRLERLARRLGIPRSVAFRGFLSQRACAERLRASDALVLPSLHECGGAVVLEAMACGLPVIATRWGGPAEYLDERCGLLVDPSSREGFMAGLTAAMLRLARDPQLRRSLGTAGWRRAVTAFDWRAKLEGMLALYHQVAGLPPPRPPARHLPARPVRAVDRATPRPPRGGLGPRVDVAGA